MAGLRSLSPDDQEGTLEDETSDAFRMYQYKVKQCCKVRPHDWCSCVYSHPGEKAKRRNPLTFTYSGTACPEYRRNGCCKRGDACPFAHGVFECWLHPTRYRTQMCSDGVNCKRRICFFAHTESELRKLEDDPLWLQQQLQMELGTENSGAPGQPEPVQQGNLDMLLNAQLTELQQQQQQQQQEDAAFGERIREVIGQFSSQGKGLTQSQMMQVLQALAEQQEQQPPPAPRNPSLPQNRSSLPNPSQAQAIQQQLGVAKGMAGRQLSGCQVEDLRGLRPSPAASRAHSDPQVQLPDNWAAAPPTPTQQQQVQQQQQPQLPQLPEELRASLLAQQLQALQVAQQGLQAPQTSQAPHRPYARSSQSAPGNQFIPMPRPSMKLLASMQQQQQQQQLQSPSLSMPTSALQPQCPLSPPLGAHSTRVRGPSSDPCVPPGKVADLAQQVLALQENMQQQAGDMGLSRGGSHSRMLFEGNPGPQVCSAPDNTSAVSSSPPLHASSKSSKFGTADGQLVSEVLPVGPASWDAEVGGRSSALQQPLTRAGYARAGVEEQGCSSSSQDARVAPPPPPQVGGPASPALEQQQQQRRRQPLQQQQLLVRPPAMAPQQLQAPHPHAVSPQQLQTPHSPVDQPLHVLPYMGDAGFVPSLSQYPSTPDRWGFLKHNGGQERCGSLSGTSDLCSYERLSRQGSADMGNAASVSSELGRMFSFERGSSHLAPRGGQWQAVLPGLDEFCHQSAGSHSVNSDPAVLSMSTGTNHDSNTTQLSSLSNFLSSSGYLGGSGSFRASPAYSHTSSSGTRGFDSFIPMDLGHGRSSMPATLAAPVQAPNEGPYGLSEGGSGVWEAKRPSKHHLARPQVLSHHLSLPGAPNTPHFRRQGASDDGSFLDIPSRPGPDSGLSDEEGQKAHAAVSALLAQVTRRHQQQQQQQQQPQPTASNPCP